MPRPIMLTNEAHRELAQLADALGYTEEMALEYALGLVGACMREGLLTDVPERLWPQQAREGIAALRSTGTQGKVLAFPSRP